jgi:hypothetical protein
MRGYLWCVVAVLLTCAACFWAAWPAWEMHVLQARYERMRIGMRLEDADSLLGPPGFRAWTAENAESVLLNGYRDGFLDGYVVPVDIDRLPHRFPSGGDIAAGRFWHRNRQWIIVSIADGKIARKSWWREMPVGEFRARVWLRTIRESLGL